MPLRRLDGFEDADDVRPEALEQVEAIDQPLVADADAVRERVEHQIRRLDLEELEVSNGIACCAGQLAKRGAVVDSIERWEVLGAETPLLVEPPMESKRRQSSCDRNVMETARNAAAEMAVGASHRPELFK